MGRRAARQPAGTGGAHCGLPRTRPGTARPDQRNSPQGRPERRLAPYGNLVLLLLADDVGGALAAAREVTAWNDELAEFDIDDELAESGLRTLHVQADVVYAAVGAC
jgi:hypothetical protein